ncbi:MAG: SIS domain-containing protein [Gemmatimonadetes bacterium]|nr:SIS domain-containing protein [Gemmatimonadota bacterium]MXX73686.1 SIS domain-containing protein [Gemmatimonadota bacterium]MYC92407.1 SIS domain-containing protein [Gemmatimonadota bacterium]MYG36852.1 SIS domain-containing protein [Gemmatimonadota bacterium]
MAPALTPAAFGEDLLELAEVARAAATVCSDAIGAYARSAAETLRSGGKLLFCGNGGSAADAQHLAAEYVVRFSVDRRALPAVALTTDSSILTACANDLGYKEVFARQIEALGRPGDLLVLHSTSGEPASLLRAAEAAAAAGIRTVAVLARGGGRLAGLVDTAVVVPTERTARAQEIQLAIGHIVCGYVQGAATTEAVGHEPGPETDRT